MRIGNKSLMKQCRTLEEYAVFVDRLRKLSKGMPIEEAAAVDTCIKDHILEAFLRKHRAEVIEVSIFYYDEEKEMKLIRRDEFEQGVAEGIAKGERIGLSKGERIGLSKGERIGLSKGERIGLNKGERLGKAQAVLELLEELGTVPDKLREEICVEQDAGLLTAWLKMAAKADDLEDFLEKYRAGK